MVDTTGLGKQSREILGEAGAGDPADMRADQLDRRHQRIGEQHRPQQAVAEVGAGLGVSGDAAGIVVGGAGDDARAKLLGQLLDRIGRAQPGRSEDPAATALASG